MSTARGHIDAFISLAGRASLFAACLCVSGCLDTRPFPGAGAGAARTDPDERDPAGESRRWPAEIENVLSVLAAREDGRTIRTDQHCAAVDVGLAHCVRVECRGVAEQTACVEIVMTARRLREVPARLDRRLEDSGLRAAPVRTETTRALHGTPAAAAGQRS